MVAAETTAEGHPTRLLLHVVKTHDGENIEAMARAHLEPSAHVVSDGLGCFRAVARIGCTHAPVVAAHEGWSEKLPCFCRFTLGCGGGGARNQPDLQLQSLLRASCHS